MATVIRDVTEMQRTAERLRNSGRRLGVVPTMGFLHEGHLALIRTARERSDAVITTIFVNPTQFGPGEDFERYPRDFDRDRSLASSAGTEYIFAPETSAIYPEDYCTYINSERLTTVLEGKSRPGHFRGVTTIVAKLFNITRPHVAVFGQKDAQQVVVVRQLIRDLNFDIELVVVPVVRERDGLAMSSRNAYLTEEQRRQAPVLFHSLKVAEQRMREGESSCARLINEMKELITARSSVVIDYVSIADAASLEELTSIDNRTSILVSLAARFGKTRLIDNVAVTL